MVLYNTQVSVNYTNNFEYRKCLRQVFNMDVTKNQPEWDKMDKDIDEETRDELMYDSDAIFLEMNSIYETTKDNHLFQEVYEICATKFFSTNPNIGMAVAFSYDFFPLFHRCLVEFFGSPENFHKENPNYISMLNAIK